MDNQICLEGIAPIVAVRDVTATTEFFTNTLDFEVKHRSGDGGYALIARGEAGLVLIRADDEASLKATANHVSAYIWVTDIDGLYAELKPRLDALPEGRVRAPFDQPYGMCEFHVKDPDGFLLFFGQEIQG